MIPGYTFRIPLTHAYKLLPANLMIFVTFTVESIIMKPTGG